MSDENFKKALAEVLGVEGGYSDLAADRGGKTSYGITEGVARGVPWLYEGDMRDLPLELAEEIYWKNYWDTNRLKLQAVSDIIEEVAREIFEQAVNTGVYPTAKRVQRVLNILNRDESLYSDMKVDGWLGATTRRAIEKLCHHGDVRYLLQWLNVAQGKHYFDLCENDPSQEVFARGWVDKRVEVRGG